MFCVADGPIVRQDAPASLAAIVPLDGASFELKSSSDAFTQLGLLVPPPSAAAAAPNANAHAQTQHTKPVVPALAPIHEHDSSSPSSDATVRDHPSPSPAGGESSNDDDNDEGGEVGLAVEQLPDYDRMFGPGNPEYAEYVQAWHQAQEAYSTPATPRSLLSPAPIPVHLEELTCDMEEPCTVLEVLVDSSRPRTGRHTPIARRSRSCSRTRSRVRSACREVAPPQLPAGSMVIPTNIQAASKRANHLAAQYHATIGYAATAPQTASTIDWTAVSTLLHQWQERVDSR